MRYKVKVGPQGNFADVCKAAARHSRVFVASEGRRTLSIGDLTEGAKEHLRSLGAQIVPEMRYDADRSAA